MKILGLTSFALAIILATATACSSVAPKKYVFFGDPTPEKVEIFEDYWKDYPFKPDDPDLPLRRGKGGVIRFFKKNNYTRSIVVDGDLTVNVYYSVDEGVTLTQPDAQMVVTSKELNEKHRKYDKETGYSYHVYLDLGEYDQPEMEITILSVFKDAKTGLATLSKEIRTTAMGTSPPVKKDDATKESDAERIARQKLGLDDEDANPIAALQAQYSARNRTIKNARDAAVETRRQQRIDLDDSQFADLPDDTSGKNASYLEEAEKRREEKLAAILRQNQEKTDSRREKRRQDVEEYLASRSERPNSRETLEFGESSNFVDLEKFSTEKKEALSRQIGERALQMEAERSAKNERTPGAQSLLKGADVGQETAASRDDEKMRASERVLSNAYRPDPNAKPSEIDQLDDFTVDSNAPPTEVYVKKYGAY